MMHVCILFLVAWGLMLSAVEVHAEILIRVPARPIHAPVGSAFLHSKSSFLPKRYRFAQQTSVSSRASSTQTLEGALRNARIAFSKGQFAQMNRSLRWMERHIALIPNKASARKMHYTLWLHLLFAKYHRVQGVVPPLQPLRTLESSAQIRQQIEFLRSSLKHVRSSVERLELYNVLFRKIVRKIRTKDAIVLLSTRTQEGILRNRAAIVQLRLDRLKQMLLRSRQKMKRHTPSSTTQKHIWRRLHILRKTQSQLKILLHRQAASIGRAERVFVHQQAIWKRKKREQFWGLTIGVSSLALGLASGALAIGLTVESDAWGPIPGVRKLNPMEAHTYKTASTGLWIAGTSFVLVGAVCLVVSIVRSPDAFMPLKGSYKAHTTFWQSPRTSSTLQTK